MINFNKHHTSEEFQDSLFKKLFNAKKLNDFSYYVLHHTSSNLTIRMRYNKYGRYFYKYYNSFQNIGLEQLLKSHYIPYEKIDYGMKCIKIRESLVEIND